MDGTPGSLITAALIITLTLTLILLGACEKPITAQRVLEQAGYEVQEVGGYGWLDCGEDDLFATRFTARQGDRLVSGTVCSGLFKGNTIRID